MSQLILSRLLQLNKSTLPTVLVRLSTATQVPVARQRVDNLERIFSRFEDRSQRSERVSEKDFIRTFDNFTRAHESLQANNQLSSDVNVNLAHLGGALLRCCGKLMAGSEVKTRELLAGNLWHFLKEKQIPLDISHYNSLLRALNENNTFFDPEKILQEIQAASLTPDRITYQRLIHQYCLKGDVTKATELLETMKTLKMELNESTFASLIIGYCKQEKPPAIAEMFELMRSNGVEPSGKAYSAAIISQLQLMAKNPDDAEKELAQIMTSVQKEDIQFSVFETIDILNSIGAVKDNPIVDTIVDYISNINYSFNARYSLYDSLLRIGQYERVSQLYWSDKPTETALKSQNLGQFYIRLLASHKDIPIEHTMRECSKLLELKYNSKTFYHLYYFAADAGNLDLVRSALKKISEEEPIKCHYLWPLIAQAKSEEELIQTLKNDVKTQNLVSNDLMDTFTQWVWPRFAEKIERLFELNKKELNFDANVLMASFLNYSIQENKVAEAIKFISEAPEAVEASQNETSSQETADGAAPFEYGGAMTSNRGNLMGRLLLQVAEHTKDPAIVSKAFNLCKLPGQPISSNSFAALIKVHLYDDNFELALQEFLKIARDHRVTPCKAELISHCLERKDSESLQKIMDVANGIYGESNSMFDLALCCLRTSKLKQAQKIFNTPNFRVNPVRIYRAARQAANAGNIEVLENLVHLTRDMYDVNQETLYQILIDAYEKTSNAKRVLNLWNRMQEEEFQPSKRSLIMIANVLERNGIEVPFQRPKDLVREDRLV